MPGIPFPSLHLCSQDPADYTCQLANTISSILRAEPRAGAGKSRKGRHGPQWVGSVVPRSSWRTGLSRGSGQHRPLQPPPIGAPVPSSWIRLPSPDIDFVSLIQAAPLGSHANTAHMRLTEAALTKQFMSLSAIDSSALGETAGSLGRRR